MPKLAIVVVSTRPGRQGLAVSKWFSDFAARHGKFEVELVDLAEVDLPLYDEPAHPRLRQYQNDHTKAWSATVEAADAFVFVSPEYNFGTPPSLVNALDYVLVEWAYKPVGFVSYGGISAGLRAVQMTKQIVTSLKMVPLVEAVPIPFFNKFINDEGVFVPAEIHEQSAGVMLDELLRWTSALSTLRQPKA